MSQANVGRSDHAWSAVRRSDLLSTFFRFFFSLFFFCITKNVNEQLIDLYRYILIERGVKVEDGGKWRCLLYVGGGVEHTRPLSRTEVQSNWVG